MSKEIFAERLKTSMVQQGKKQVDLIRMAKEQGVKLGKSQISQYVSGKTVPRADTGSKIKQEKGTVPHGGLAPAHCVRQSRSLQGFPPLLKEMALRCRIWNNRFLDRCFNSPKAQKFQRMTRCFGRFL